MKKSLVAAAVAAACLQQAEATGNQANDAYYPSKDYVRFDADQGSASPDAWVSNEAGAWPAVADGETPHPNADHDYYISYAWRRIAMKKADSEAAALPFAGRSLTVNCEILNAGAYGAWVNFGNNVTLLGGSMFWWNSIGSVTGEKITLERCNATWPVTFRYAARSVGDKIYEIKFRPAVVADADAVLVWKHNGTTPGMSGGKFVLCDSWPDFHGTLRFQSENNTFAPATFSLPGSVVVEEQANFLPTASSGVSSLGSLAVASGATVGFAAANNTQTFEIADKLELAPGAIVAARKFTSWANGTPKKHPVFTLSAAAVAAGVPEMDGVVYGKADVTNVRGDLPRTRWTVDELPDGGAEIGVVYNEIVSITNSTKWAETPFYEDGSADCDPAKYLSDGQPFHGGVDYYSPGYNLIMRAKAYPYVFPGDSLTLSAASVGFYGDFTCAEFALCDNGRFRLMSGSPTIAGNIKTFASTGTDPAWRMNVGNQASYRIAANISGTGLLSFGLDPENTAPENFCGGVELKGDNSGFAGTMLVTAGQAGDFAKYFVDKGFAAYAPSAVSNVTLSVWNGTALGGAIPTGFCRDSLKLDVACRLSICDTLTFNEPTRGWYVPASAYLKVAADKCATVNQILTLGDGATVVKEGDGTLLLGAAVAVENGGAATIRAEAGAFGATVANAFAGLDVAVGRAASLGVSVAGDGIDLSQMNAFSFEGEEDDEPQPLKIVIDMANEEMFRPTYDVALLRFKTGSHWENVFFNPSMSAVSLAHAPRGYAVESVSVSAPDANDMVTLSAHVVRRPLAFIVR